MKQKEATFTFSSEPNSISECKLDAAAFCTCVSPTRYTGLVSGSHTFEMRATDAAGNTDPIRGTRTWRSDAGLTKSLPTHSLCELH